MAFKSHKVWTYGRHKQRTITAWFSPDADTKTKHVFSSPENDIFSVTSNSSASDDLSAAAEPSHSEPSHSEPSHSEPSHSEPSHSEPSRSKPSHSDGPSDDDHVFDSAVMGTSTPKDLRNFTRNTAPQRAYSSTLDVPTKRVTRSSVRRICTSTPEANFTTQTPVSISNGDVQDTINPSPHQANCGCMSCKSRQCGTPDLYDLTNEISRLSLNNTNNHRPSVDQLISPCSVVVTPLSLYDLSIHSTSPQLATSQEVPEKQRSDLEAKPQSTKSRNAAPCDHSMEVFLQNNHCQSFKEVLTPVKNKATGRFLMAEHKVLQQCSQTGPVPFAEGIPPAMIEGCVKIGEGVYGEVFRTVNTEGQMVALKIIPIEGDLEVNGEPQKSFEEILPEIVISRELSALRGGEANVTEGFILVNGVSCCQGAYPRELLNQWDEYDARKESENDRPDFFPEDQLFIVFEFDDGGVDLETKTLSSMYQAVGILQQVAISLAVAEQRLEFEHRDLHWGNVLVLPNSKPTIKLWLDGAEINVATHGVQVGLIDFTLSRLKKDGCTVFCDLSTDETLFTGQGDLQFDIYRKMKDENDNTWEPWNPHTNVLWLHYLLDKLLNSKTYPSTKLDPSQSSLRRKLRNFGRHLLGYASALSVVRESNILDM